MTRQIDHEHRATVLSQALEENPPSPSWRTVYGVNGEEASLYAIDAKDAVTRFPEMWSYDPWPRKRK